MKKTAVRVLALLLVVLASLSATAGAKTVKIMAYLAPLTEDAFWVASIEAFKKEAARLGYEPKVYDAKNNSTQQLNQFDYAISLNPAAIVVAAVDNKAVITGVERARQEKIPVIALGRTIDQTKVDMTVIAGTIAMGNLAGITTETMLKKKYGTVKGTVLEVMGDPADNFSTEVGQGFHAIVDKNKSLKIIIKTTKDWEPSRAASTVEDQLTTNKDIDLIFLHSDWLASGVVAYLEQQKYGKTGEKNHIILLATGGAPEGLNYIRNKWMDAIIEEPISDEAIYSVRYADKLVKGGKISAGTVNINGLKGEIKMESYGPTLLIPAGLIDSKNCDDPRIWGNSMKK